MKDSLKTIRVFQPTETVDTRLNRYSELSRLADEWNSKWFKVLKALQEKKLETGVLFIHDQVRLDIPKGEYDQVVAILKEVGLLR